MANIKRLYDRSKASIPYFGPPLILRKFPHLTRAQKANAKFLWSLLVLTEPWLGDKRDREIFWRSRAGNKNKLKTDFGFVSVHNMKNYFLIYSQIEHQAAQCTELNRIFFLTLIKATSHFFLGLSYIQILFSVWFYVSIASFSYHFVFFLIQGFFICSSKLLWVLKSKYFRFSNIKMISNFKVRIKFRK